jgi:hypothetical protein
VLTSYKIWQKVKKFFEENKCSTGENEVRISKSITLTAGAKVCKFTHNKIVLLLRGDTPSPMNVMLLPTAMRVSINCVTAIE